MRRVWGGVWGLLLVLAGLGQAAEINGNLTLQGRLNACDDAGTTDTYACAVVPPLRSYRIGTRYAFKANTANTGAASINFNGLGARTIVKMLGGVATALTTNDIHAGMFVELLYDGTNMQLRNVLVQRRTCMMVVGSDNGAILTDADLGPQLRQCVLDSPATVEEIRIMANAGTPSVIVQTRTITGTATALLSAALSTGAAGVVACARSGGGTSYDGSTACSATLQNHTGLTAGMTLGITSGTAGGTAQQVTVAVTYIVN